MVVENNSLDNHTGGIVAGLAALPRRQRIANVFHRRLANPVMRRWPGLVPGTAVLETTGWRSGLTRRTPIGGRIIDGAFWLVSDHGRRSAYVRNIEAHPRVRVRVNGRWHPGTAHPVDADDPLERLHALPRLNGLLVRGLGTDLLSIRIDFDD
jgi:deazaflavin-dependent oxidoreductase (nitroreductase family)